MLGLGGLVGSGVICPPVINSIFPGRNQIFIVCSTASKWISADAALFHNCGDIRPTCDQSKHELSDSIAVDKFVLSLQCFLHCFIWVAISAEKSFHKCVMHCHGQRVFCHHLDFFVPKFKIFDPHFFNLCFSRMYDVVLRL